MLRTLRRPDFFRVWIAACVVSNTASAGQVQLEPVRDAAIYAESATAANGSGSYLFAGNNSGGSTRRALLAFDIAAAVPAGATITSVQLTLTVSQANAGVAAHALHRLTAAWSEGPSDPAGAEGSGTTATTGDATWTERGLGTLSPWTNPGGDFAAAASSTTSIDGVGLWSFPSTPALVADAQSMLDAPATNFGWIVRGTEVGGNTAKRFDSRSAVTVPTRPRLIVDFVPPCAPPTIYCVGAPNSVSTAGAAIGWSGQQSVAANTFTLTATNVPPNTTGVFFFGPTTANVPFGNGLRCVGGPLRRTPTVTATAGGAAQRTLDFTVDQGDDITPGSTWNFQLWYRDTAAGGAGFNLSNALSATFCP